MFEVFQQFVILIVLTNSKVFLIETKLKQNLFDPVLSSNSYIGHIKEDERIVEIQPDLNAFDADLSNSPNGKICGYELSLHKHDDNSSTEIPFFVQILNQQPIIKLKTNIDKLDCEIQQIYRLFIRAFDCANGNKRRYSERSSLIITIDDVNEFSPIFTHKNYLFKVHQDQICSTCRVEATDDDCGNVDHRVCNYQIKTPDVPFSIDTNGLISITKTLTKNQYEFDVVAIDCFPISSNNKTDRLSEPAKVAIRVIQTCKPMITDDNPTKLTVHSDHTHIFDTIHVDTCDETCAVEDIVGTITLDSQGIDNGCNLEQCSLIKSEYVLIPKDIDYDRIPQTRYMSFNGFNDALVLNKTIFSGQFNNDFTIRMWMKHSNDENNEKQHIFCKTDEKFKNRHHIALFIQNNHLKLLIRKSPSLSNDNNFYASEWIWKLSQINDGQWHSYKIFVNYPNKIDLYIDDELFQITNENFQMIEDFPLSFIAEAENTIFTLGACWHARASHMVQHFYGQLSGLIIEQKEELQRSATCIRDCQEYLDMSDIEKESSIEFVSNSNRSVWMLRTDSTESFEQLLKHIVYRNLLKSIGPEGQRIVSIQTAMKCLGENYTYNFPLFIRRLVIDEIIHPTKIELKTDSNILINEQTINQGIYLFRNLSIYTDNLKKSSIEITGCSINTSPDLTNNEQLIVPDDNHYINNLHKDLTKTGLLLSGSGSIDSYQYLLQQIAYLSKSPIKYLDRTFSMICLGAHDQISTNEIRVRIHVEKQIAPPAPVAAVLSNQLYVENDHIKDNLFDIEENSHSTKNSSGWPIAVVVCVSVGLAGVLVLYLVVRIRSGNGQTNRSSGTGDDAHFQMEWEDDIGLNITVNPMDETKKPVQSILKQTIHENSDSTTEDDEDDDDDDDQSHNEYSSEDDEYETNQIHAKENKHQLEWDDEPMEYGPKKV